MTRYSVKSGSREHMQNTHGRNYRIKRLTLSKRREASASLSMLALMMTKLRPKGT